MNIINILKSNRLLKIQSYPLTNTIAGISIFLLVKSSKICQVFLRPVLKDQDYNSFSHTEVNISKDFSSSVKPAARSTSRIKKKDPSIPKMKRAFFITQQEAQSCWPQGPRPGPPHRETFNVKFQHGTCLYKTHFFS